MIALDKQAHFWAGMALTAAALPFDIVVAVMGARGWGCGVNRQYSTSRR